MTRTVIAALLAAAAATTHADNPLGHDDDIYAKCMHQAVITYQKEQEGHSSLNREGINAASDAYDRCYQKMTKQDNKDSNQVKQTGHEELITR